MPEYNVGQTQTFTPRGNGNRGTTLPYAHSFDFEHGQSPTGSEDERQRMLALAMSAQGRAPSGFSNSQAYGDIDRSLLDRERSQAFLGSLEEQAMGGSTPQQSSLAQALAASQGAQTSLARSGTGLAAVAGAGRDAAAMNQQIGLEGGQQMALQKALDMASARDQLGAAYSSMGQQDLSERALAQQQAERRAGLADSQLARDDAMARYYLNERYQVGRQQLGANMAWEQQNYANRSGQSNLADANAERRSAWERQDQAGAARAIGEGASVLSDQSQAKKSPYQQPTQKSSPYDSTWGY